MSQCNQGSPSFQKKKKKKKRNTASLKCENLFIFPFGDA
jgi:hypothetical protein